MPVPSSTRQRVAEILPGERIDYVFPASIPVTWLFGNVIVAVTGRAVVVLSVGFFGRYRPRSVVATFPRGTRLGPPDLHGVPSITLGGIVYEIEDEYLAVINAVDAEGLGAEGFPDDPLPDL